MKQITSLEKNINQEFSQFKETFSNISCNLNTPENSLTNFSVYGINSTFKKSVIDSVINVLSNIPTDMDNEQIKEIIEYFAIIYETSLNIHDFYNNISNSTKINKDPYNTKYARLVLYLINKFDNDYSCSENLSSDTNNSLRQSSTQQLPTLSSTQQLPTLSSTQQLPNISSTQETMMQKTLSQDNTQQLPPNMINQTRMMQQASMMNLPNMQSQNSNIVNEASSTTYGKTENIKDMINKLSATSSEGIKKCKITKPNNNYNLNNTKTENFNNIDTYNNAFMEHYASF